MCHFSCVPWFVYNHTFFSVVHVSDIYSSLLSVAIHVLFSNRKKQTNNVVFIHLNLCIALALALLVFVAGIETAKDSKVRKSTVCQTIINH